MGAGDQSVLEGLLGLLGVGGEGFVAAVSEGGQVAEAGAVLLQPKLFLVWVRSAGLLRTLLSLVAFKSCYLFSIYLILCLPLS